jgi:ankyrin repeat protein
MDDFPERERALMQHINAGDAAKVKKAIEGGADFHIANDYMLYRAAEQGHIDVVKLLLDLGADIHTKDDLAMRWAAHNGKTATVAYLISRGADVHADNDMALRWAAQHGRDATVSLLLDNGADIHTGNDIPLCQAAIHHHKSTVAILLSRGADVHADENSPLHWALIGGDRDIGVMILREGAKPYVRENPAKSPSHDTLLAEWLEDLRQSVAKHFNIGKPSRVQCFSGPKLLHEAVLDACVTGQFVPCIATPLINSRKTEDRKLFADIWQALPPHWQGHYQNTCMQFAKEGGTKPFAERYTQPFPPDEKKSGRHA